MLKTPVPNKTIAKKTTLKKRAHSRNYKTAEMVPLHVEEEAGNAVHELIMQLLTTDKGRLENIHLVEEVCVLLRNMPAGKVRESLVRKIAESDKVLAAEIAYTVRLHTLKECTLLESMDADVDVSEAIWSKEEGLAEKKASIGNIYHNKCNIRYRRIAILAADGVNNASFTIIKNALLQEGAEVDILAPSHGLIVAEDNSLLLVKQPLHHATALYYDAVYVAGGKKCVAALLKEIAAIRFLDEAYRHCKAIAFNNDALPFISYTSFGAATSCMEGIVTDSNMQLLCEQFIEAIAHYRFWERQNNY